MKKNLILFKRSAQHGLVAQSVAGIPYEQGVEILDDDGRPALPLKADQLARWLYGGVIFGEVVGTTIRPLGEFFGLKDSVGQLSHDFQASEAALLTKLRTLEGSLDEGIQMLQNAKTVGNQSPQIAQALAKLNEQVRGDQLSSLFPGMAVHTAFSAQISGTAGGPPKLWVTIIGPTGKKSTVMAMADTGASIMCIDPAKSDELGIRPTGVTYVRGIDNVSRQMPKCELDVEFPKGIKVRVPAAIHSETKSTGYPVLVSWPAIQAANQRGANIVIK